MPAWRTQLLSRRTGGHDQSGQALLELALVVPVLVLIAMAIFQFAFVLESQMGLTNAVREAARRAAAAASVNPNWASLDAWTLEQLNGDGTPSNPGLFARNVQGFDPARLWAGNPDVTFCTYAVAGATNYRVEIGVKYEHPVFFALMNFATDAIDGTENGEWDLGATAQMRLEDVDPAVASDPGPCT